MTAREREILGLLAQGLNGAAIAETLVLSPATVRTHVRNAMKTLGASTRSQAVALALRDSQLAGATWGSEPRAESTQAMASAFEAMLSALVSLPDIDACSLYVTDPDGLSLSRVATSGESDTGREEPPRIGLGDGPLGRAALERRVRLVQAMPKGAGRVLLVAPIVAAGKLVGLLTLATRASRAVAHHEVLLVQALAAKIGDAWSDGNRLEQRLDRLITRFKSSWTAVAVGR